MESAEGLYEDCFGVFGGGLQVDHFCYEVVQCHVCIAAVVQYPSVLYPLQRSDTPRHASTGTGVTGGDTRCITAHWGGVTNSAFVEAASTVEKHSTTELLGVCQSCGILPADQQNVG
jgi:hypothetical protein